MTECFMQFSPYTISEIIQAVPEVFIIKLKPKIGSTFSFLPGQFAAISNPNYSNPAEPHYFSIASSPLSQDHLEFCFRVYGNWTQAFSKKQIGEEIFVSGAFGSFVWNENIDQAVFLAGGVGIAPFMSMLRTLHLKNQTPEITLLYGSRTLETIIFKNELEQLVKTINTLKVVHILSEVGPTNQWSGARGFMTAEFIKKEVEEMQTPKFFLCGPPIFVQKLNQVLSALQIAPEKISKEQFTGSAV